MKKEEAVKRCRKCGKPIAVIIRGLYRKVLVDAEPEEIIPDANGEEFIRGDGTKMRGKPLYDYDDDTIVVDIGWRPHRCGGGR